MKTGVIYAKCEKTKKDFAVAIKEAQGGWYITRAYPLGKTKQLYEDKDAGFQYDGHLYMHPDYNGCPHCQSMKGLVLCGNCEHFNCYDGRGSFTCAYCGKSSKVSGKIDGFSGSEGQ
ncbi:MAG: hypothetical protein K6G22_06125 [Lachnospiraceae bacterium]|nr:hypothetical protein [Lachnospiraceae bacterium]